MIRRTGCGPAGRNGIVPGLAAVTLVAALLLPAAPAEAGWLGRGLGVAGAARSLKRNLGEAVDLLDETLGAAIQGDFEEVERLSGELREVPGNIITDAFPALSIGEAALKKAVAAGARLKAARRRVGRFVGEAVTDARMALEAGDYEIEAGVLDQKKPLPAVTLSGPAGTKRPVPARSSAVRSPDPWGQEPEEDEETATLDADPWGEDDQKGREGGDKAIDGLQGEYAAALDRFLSAEEGSSNYEAALGALLEREKELLAGAAGQEEQELSREERLQVQVCLKEREFDPGAVDGFFGPGTRTAIRAWQAAQGREASGYMNKTSSLKLLEECEVALAEAGTAEELSTVGSQAGTAITKVSVERTFEPKCAAIFDGRPEAAKDELLDKIEMCYLQFVNNPGCHLPLNKKGIVATIDQPSLIGASPLSIGHIRNWIVSSSFPMEVIGLRWSGGCSGGVPDGKGTLSALMPRYYANLSENHEFSKWSQEWTGRFVDGVPQGNWTSSHRIAGRTSSLYNGETVFSGGVKWIKGQRYSTSYDFQYEYKFVMVNGQLHGDYIFNMKEIRTGHGAHSNESICVTSTGKFVNGEYHRGGGSSC